MSKPTPVAWMRWNDAAKTSTGVTDTSYYRDLWASEGDTIVPLYSSSALHALEEENARLRARLAIAYSVKTDCNDQANFERARATAAEARLKEASELISRAQQNTPEHFSNWHDAARRFMEESR